MKRLRGKELFKLITTFKFTIPGLKSKLILSNEINEFFDSTYDLANFKKSKV